AGRIGPRTRAVSVSHITSPTALVLPVGEICAAAREHGVLAVVDGAHAPGQVPVDLDALGADVYAGNCHKWLCAPKGAAFLHVRRDRQENIRPLVISHGANSSRTDRSRFLIEFGWMGTGDPSAALSVPEAIRVMGSLLPGGWPGVMRRNRELAVAGRRILCESLGIQPPCPDEWLGSLASLPLPDAATPTPSKSPLYLDPLQDWLMENGKIEIPVIPWPAPPKRLIRISAQLYNSLPQYRHLAQALKKNLQPT
ncbi:MAG TPA: aminotransferase class V-fold PLP-dependent enzyme, partial [Pirellulaceae bacterium]|nr:aminotransferase class V-fold PLP-dependent enzyme [Pirellulaceae bacterium]